MSPSQQHPSALFYRYRSETGVDGMAVDTGLEFSPMPRYGIVNRSRSTGVTFVLVPVTSDYPATAINGLPLDTGSQLGIPVFGPLVKVAGYAYVGHDDAGDCVKIIGYMTWPGSPLDGEPTEGGFMYASRTVSDPHLPKRANFMSGSNV